MQTDPDVPRSHRIVRRSGINTAGLDRAGDSQRIGVPERYAPFDTDRPRRFGAFRESLTGDEPLDASNGTMAASPR